MTQQNTEIKTFQQARQRLEQMAAGKYCDVGVNIRGGGEVERYTCASIYIEGLSTAEARTWDEAFAMMKARIRAIDSDHNPEELAAGVDEAMGEVANG